MAETSEETINGTISENLKKSIALKSFDFPEDSDQFQNDKNCSNCQILFGKIGIVHAKKYMCMFCHRGVCAKCSLEKLYHPNTKKEEKICISCLEKLMSVHLSVDYNKKLNDLRSEKENLQQELEYKIKENQIEMSQNHYNEEVFRNESNNYKLRIKDLEKNIEELTKNNREISVKHDKLKEIYKTYISDMNSKKKTIEKYEKNAEELKETYNNNKDILPLLRNKLAELQDEKIKYEAQLKEKKSLARSLTLTEKEKKLYEDLDESKHKIHVTEEEKNILEEEIWKTTQENEDLDDKIIERDLQNRRDSDSLIVSSSSKFSQEEESRIKDLRDKSKENVKKIQTLREKIEESKIYRRKVNMSTDVVPEPGSRPCARCIIS